MGLGTVASDLLIALIVTSVLRRRLGYRAWRAVHWAAYACWPVAILHGLGTGSDTKATWMLALTLASVAAVVVAVLARVARPGTSAQVRIGGTSAATLSVIGLAVWLPGGPLGTGWAKRSGTPASVLTAFKPKVAAATATTTVARTAPDPFGRSFSASFAGPLHEGTSAGGLAVVDLNLRLQGQPDGILRIRLGGAALPGGGLRMDRSAVTLGPPGRPGEYQGKVDFLQNSRAAREGRQLRGPCAAARRQPVDRAAPTSRAPFPEGHSRERRATAPGVHPDRRCRGTSTSRSTASPRAAARC